MVAFGVFIFPTDKAIDPMQLAREVEARGFESLWFPEHSHIPTSRESPWGLRENAPPLPEEYWRTHDQFVALAMAAAVTERIKLGTGITLVAQHDPIWLAKSVASLDALSKGRLLFGVGYGWNREELEHHGVAFGQRRAVLRERILAMKELWANDEAEFKGEHVSFSSSWQWPKPHQAPHPPVILGGGAGPRTMQHIVEFCDGFMPIAGRYDASAQFEQIRRLASEAGRDPASIELGQFGPPPKPEIVETMIASGCSALSGRTGSDMAGLWRHLPL
jgi:probable F420-dependent oxidoreductase